MTRYSFAVTLVVLAVCLGPFGLASAADAQQPSSPRHIGVVTVSFSPESKEGRAFLQGLEDAGYAQGRDVLIEWRFAGGDYAKVPGMVEDLVKRKVEVMVVESTVAIQSAERATSSIPIVMAVASDPVGLGLVASYAHPGGNVTGLSLMQVEVEPKRLQLLKEALPKLNRVAVLWDPATPPNHREVRDLKIAAPSLSLTLTFVSVRRAEDLEAAFAMIRKVHAQALLVLGGPLLTGQLRTRVFDLANQSRLPAISSVKVAVEAGALMSYGAEPGDMFRRAAGYVVKILKGARPADLPIEQPTKFELVVNLKTAKALGLTIPETLLATADEVIQ